MNWTATFWVLAVSLLGIAIYFFSVGDQDWAFAFFAFAACSFFFGMRFQLKARVAARDAEDKD